MNYAAIRAHSEPSFVPYGWDETDCEEATESMRK